MGDRFGGISGKMAAAPPVVISPVNGKLVPVGIDDKMVLIRMLMTGKIFAAVETHTHPFTPVRKKGIEQRITDMGIQAALGDFQRHSGRHAVHFRIAAIPQGIWVPPGPRQFAGQMAAHRADTAVIGGPGIRKGYGITLGRIDIHGELAGLLQPRLAVQIQPHRMSGHIHKPERHPQTVSPVHQPFIIFPLVPESGKNPVRINRCPETEPLLHTRHFRQCQSCKNCDLHPFPGVVLHFVQTERTGVEIKLIRTGLDGLYHLRAFIRGHDAVSRIIAPDEPPQKTGGIKIRVPHVRGPLRVPLGSRQCLFPGSPDQIRIAGIHGHLPEHRHPFTGTGGNSTADLAEPFDF